MSGMKSGLKREATKRDVRLAARIGMIFKCAKVPGTAVFLGERDTWVTVLYPDRPGRDVLTLLRGSIAALHAHAKHR